MLSELKEGGVVALPEIAKEIRSEIVKVVSVNGGHLAPSLGVVDFTIAWHYVFNSPQDKIVWDVSHQSYAHKILTGRRNQFKTIRKPGGLSGFTNRFESEHDVFGAGHASTSISAALGIACGRDLNGENYNVTALIGDGSLTGGEALEGLNNAGHLNKDILVVLNDNGMSISKNIGNLQQRDLGAIFTQLGFFYEGVVDGHDIAGLINVLEKLKNIPGAKLLHINTQKGKGYEFAQEDAVKFHGISAFCVDTGKVAKASNGLTYSQVFGNALIKLARENKDIIAITAAMKTGTGLSDFAKEFPDRFFDVGIAEEHAVTFAAGLAANGKRPVFAVYSTFLQRALDQIIHDVALQKLPVVFAIDRAGIVGDDGPTHHGIFDLSYLSLVPGLTVCAPKDEQELGDLLFSALKYNSPVAIRYPRGSGPGVSVSNNFNFIDQGQAEILADGEDVLLIGFGVGVELARKASAKLLEKNIYATVINARFLKPLDDKILELAKKIKKIIIIEENTINGGFGSYISMLLAGENVLIKFVALPNKFIAHGETDNLRQENGFSIENIINNVLELV